jgi:molybdate transport system regulatory protein
MSGIRLTLRVDFGSDRALGPGKVKLLETIGKTGSITQAGRALGMSYRRAWLLVDDLNHSFREAVVIKKPGGVQGGGATLTKFGRELIAKYRAIETKATAMATRQFEELEISSRKPAPRGQKSLKTSIRLASGSQRSGRTD